MTPAVTNRMAIKPGITVDIILKADQRSGKCTRGIVQEILTNSAFHPHGIKVRLKNGQVGRVAAIVTPIPETQSSRTDTNKNIRTDTDHHIL